MIILKKIDRVITAPHCIHTGNAVHTVSVWIVRRAVSYNLGTIMKAATALIVVSSPSITTPRMLCFLLPVLCTEMKIWYVLQFDVRIVEFVVIEYFSCILME